MDMVKIGHPRLGPDSSIYYPSKKLSAARNEEAKATHGHLD